MTNPLKSPRLKCTIHSFLQLEKDILKNLFILVEFLWQKDFERSLKGVSPQSNTSCNWFQDLRSLIWIVEGYQPQTQNDVFYWIISLTCSCPIYIQATTSNSIVLLFFLFFSFLYHLARLISLQSIFQQRLEHKNLLLGSGILMTDLVGRQTLRSCIIVHYWLNFCCQTESFTVGSFYNTWCAISVFIFSL